MLKSHAKGTLLNLYIQPGAAKNEFVAPHGEALKIKVKAPPVDGKANVALIEFLAQTFDVAKKHVHLIKGETSRQKSFLIEGVSLKETQSTLKRFYATEAD